VQLNDRCEIKESFIDFVPCDDKTGAGLAEKLCSVLEDEGLNFGYMRGQGYDNGFNMDGIYNVVQALILKQNASCSSVFALCCTLVKPCGCSCSISQQHNGVIFWYTIEKFYVFFSSSTTRCQVLIDKVKISLKSH